MRRCKCIQINNAPYVNISTHSRNSDIHIPTLLMKKILTLRFSKNVQDNSNNFQKQNFEETFKDCAPACNRSDQKLIERFDMAKTNVLLNGWKIILDKKS